MVDQQFCVQTRLGEHTVRGRTAARNYLEYTAWSKGAQEKTDYTIELFDVALHDNTAASRLDGDPNNRWLSEAEIDAGECTDGALVSDTMKSLLRQV